MGGGGGDAVYRAQPVNVAQGRNWSSLRNIIWNVYVGYVCKIQYIYQNCN